jgi:hypothetical protein
LRTQDFENPVEPSPIDVVQDLIDSATPGPLGEKPLRTKASWALYRAALLWHLSSRRHQNIAYETAYQMLADTKSPSGVKKSPPKTKVTFAGNDFVVIINALGSIDRLSTTWGAKTSYWMQAGIAAGARGGEWNGTSWLDRDKCQLLIPNSKRKVAAPPFVRMAEANATAANNNTPAVKSIYELDHIENDDHSNMDMDTRSDEINISLTGEEASHRIVRIDRNDAIYIDMHLASIEQHAIAQSKHGVSRDDAFIRYYEMARRTLRKACDTAFKGKRYYRLYNTRSQFAANKKVDHPIGAVAAMMGHTGTRTTMGSYGSRADGLKGRKGQSDTVGQSILDAFNQLEGESSGNGLSNSEFGGDPK